MTDIVIEACPDPTARPVPDLPGYWVSEAGAVWSNISGKWRHLTPSVLSHKPGAQGYLRVTVNTPKGRRAGLVHVLVAAAFLGPKPEGMQVHHIDGNARNNALSNLRYATQSEIIRQAFARGLNVHTRGSEHPMAELTEDDVILVRIAHGRGYSMGKLAQVFKVSRHCIKHIVNRKTWAHLD